MQKTVEELNARVKEYQKKLKAQEKDAIEKDSEIKHYKGIAEDMSTKLQISEGREAEFEHLLSI